MPEDFEGVAIIPVQAIGGSEPHEALFVLEN